MDFHYRYMDALQSAFLPLGAFWIAVQTIQGSVTFVNDMRETIITGQYNGIALTLKHRRAIYYDWILSMCGNIFVLFMFSGVIFWLASQVQVSNVGINILPAMTIVGISTFLGGVLFLLCGFSDYKLIQSVLRDARHQQANTCSDPE